LPPWDDDTINYVYDKNKGYCWHCDRKLSFINYGKFGKKGAWEIDHSVPKARGGTDNRNNLVPSCMICNRSKQDLNSRQFGDYVT
jgi:5-methylcytosine-specific restriction endonuclease McrA